MLQSFTELSMSPTLWTVLSWIAELGLTQIEELHCRPFHRLQNRKRYISGGGDHDGQIHGSFSIHIYENT